MLFALLELCFVSVLVIPSDASSKVDGVIPPTSLILVNANVPWSQDASTKTGCDAETLIKKQHEEEFSFAVDVIVPHKTFQVRSQTTRNSDPRSNADYGTLQSQNVRFQI